MVPHYDAVVVGLGGVGSFALRALAKEKSRVKRRFLGVELGSLLPPQRQNTNSLPKSSTTESEDDEAGHSSRGLSRIYRRAYFEHANYVPWIEYSLNVFREMEEANGLSLMKECGMLLIEPTPVIQEKNLLTKSSHMNQNVKQQLPPYISSSLHSANIHNIAVEFLDSTQLKTRFPQFHYGDHEMVGLLEPGGGLLRPEQIMKVALGEASAHNNVTILDNTCVTKLQDFDEQGIVELHLLPKNSSDKIKVTTSKLLVSMGARTATVIPAWEQFLYPVRQIQGWIDTRHKDNLDSMSNIFSSRMMPAYVYISPDWPEGLYGVPCDDEGERVVNNGGPFSTHHHHWLKVGIHKQTFSTTEIFSFPDHSPKASPDEVSELQQVVPLCIEKSAWCRSEHSRELPQLVDTKPCLYTMTTDKHFVIGEVSRNIFCVAGLSGHGFKMTPALGQMMADFAFGKDVRADWKTDFCSPKRFGIGGEVLL
jgi:sarcosine oxidase